MASGSIMIYFRKEEIKASHIVEFTTLKHQPHFPTSSIACVIPTGIGRGDILDFSTLNFEATPQGIFASAIVAGALPAVVAYEISIQARLVLAADTVIYNAAAAFEEKALDIYGRLSESEARRRCSSEILPTLFDQHRQVTLAYAVLWGMKTFLGGSNGAFDGLATTWNLDLDICISNDCSDLSTPWGLATSLVNDAVDIFSRDGWNADGSLNAEYNKIPYSDWRDKPYTPDTKKPFSWKPLLETNYLGFLYRQEHETPHIGFTSKSFFVGDDKVCSRRLESPNYNYEEEIKLLLQRSAALDELQKAEIEFFDSKFTSLVPLTAQLFARQGKSLDSFEFILFDAMTIGVVYEAVLQVWREKILHDLIRPTTIIHREKAGEMLVAYQGPSKRKIGNIMGDEWQPYIRIMPHAEYPSGSSCICKSFARAAILFSGDNVTALLGGPLAETVLAGSSRVEPGKSPTEDLVLQYSSWTEISDRCSATRLEGGMHFLASITDGAVLCEDIGDDLYTYFMNLKDGVVPSYTANVTTQPTQEERCSLSSPPSPPSCPIWLDALDFVLGSLVRIVSPDFSFCA